MRRMTNEAAPEDLRHLRVGRAGGGLQGRADAEPVLDRTGQDPPFAVVRNLRSAPAAAQHRDQAGSAAGAPPLHQGLHRLSAPSRVEGQPGGRWGQVIVLAGSPLLAPPMFLFGPLAALLLVSRPATVREWVWLLGALSWSALWLHQAGGLS